MPTTAHVKVLLMCDVVAIEFTLVCFWVELQLFLVVQKYHSLESLYEFCSLTCSVVSVSSDCILTALVAFVCL